MFSIVPSVLKTTIGLLIGELAERLKDGDVTDQKLYSWIVSQNDEIRSKLNASSKKDLETSISFFEEGMGLLFEVFEIAKSTSECGAVAAEAACDEAFSFLKGIRRLDLTGLDESATKKLFKAKKRFEDARRKATTAFNNEGLNISDRILAMKYRVVATILESVDDPADAVTPCRVCVKELNCLPAVQNTFDVQLKKGFLAVRGLVGKEERKEIISRVCHVNHAIYDVTRTIGGDASFLTWPPVDVGGIKINPVFDARVSKVLLEQGMERCCVTPWSLGQEGEKKQKLRYPWGITTNSSGEFIVGEWCDGCVKVFDSSGKFVKHFSLPEDGVNTNLYIFDVATDMNDNIFVLAKLEKPETKSCWVYTLTKTADLSYRFRLRRQGECERLSVSDTGKVMTLRSSRAVEEYDTNGKFVRRFGEGILKDAWDVTVATDGRVKVMDDGDSCVHIFSEEGDHLNKFKLRKNDCDYRSITFHRTGEHIIVAGVRRKRDLLQVEIYSKDGEFVRSVEIQNYGIYGHGVKGITVTTEGRVAVVVQVFESHKILVF